MNSPGNGHPTYRNKLFQQIMILKTCRYIVCLRGYIPYGVHLCNKILMFQGKTENGPARHPVLRERYVSKTPLHLSPMNGLAQSCAPDEDAPIGHPIGNPIGHPIGYI